MTTAANNFQQELAFIRSDRAHGAGFMAQRAIWALAQAASEDDATERSVVAAAEEMVSVRPHMASIGNSVCLLLAQLQEAGWDRAKAPALAAALIAQLQQLAEEAAGHAAAVLPLTGLVLTCSSSDTVVQTLLAARQTGRQLTAKVLPSAGYGRLMASEARDLGVEMEVVNTLPKGVTAEDTVGLIGADAVVAGKVVVNGAPSLGLARWCFDRGLHFYVVCDSLKLLDRLPADTALPRGMQRVPMRYVTAVVTELGA